MRIVSIPFNFLASMTSLAIGTFLFACSMGSDVIDEINAINESAQFGRSLAHLHKQISEFIRFTNLKRFEFEKKKIEFQK